MLGILKIGFVPKLILVAVIAAGVAYLGRALVSPAPTPATVEPAIDISNSPPPSGLFHSAHAKINSTSPFLRIIIFVLVAALLPFATVSIVKKVLGERSNKYNFLLLAAYTAFDFLLALVLVGILLTDFWAFFLLIVAAIASGVYNFAVLNRIEELENG
jgi:hypothetical protein